MDTDTVPITVAYAADNGELLCGAAGAFEKTRTGIEVGVTDRREHIEREQRIRIQCVADVGLHG